LPEAISKQLFKAIKGTEFEGKVYFAGGCVRDELLGRKTQDIDITVELPEGGIRLAEYLYKQKVSTKPVIYKQFGTALVTIGNYKIELVMTRRENYRSRSRKPEVAFGTLQEDVLRRDFTINALLKSVSEGNTIDLSGMGSADLKAGVIRATSKPDIMFKEDPLRLLRAVRFAVELDFSIETKTLAQIKLQANELQNISGERISEELLRILKHPNYFKGLNLLSSTGLSAFIFQDLKTSPVFKLSQPLILSNICSPWLKPALKRLSLQSKIALIIWNAKEPAVYLKQLKLSVSDRKHIISLITLCKEVRYRLKHNKLQMPAQFLKAADEIGLFINDILDLYPLTGLFYGTGKAELGQDIAVCRSLKASVSKLKDYRFNLTGDDLIRSFCIKGAQIGLMLFRARDYWYEHPQAGREELLGYLMTKYAVKDK